jgi:hypothetical protein
MNASNVGKALFILILFRHMKEFTQERSPLPVSIVEKLLLVPVPLYHMNGSTEERNPRYVSLWGSIH